MDRDPGMLVKAPGVGFWGPALWQALLLMLMGGTGGESLTSSSLRRAVGKPQPRPTNGLNYY